MTMEKLLESKEKMRIINKKRKESQLNKIKISTPPKKMSFDEKYKRMTTYVEKDLLELIKKLKDTGHIGTMTDFVNKAFKEYIRNHIKA